MPNTVLGLNIKTGTPQVKTYANLQAAALGVTFGANEGQNLTLDTHRGRVVRFGGHATIIASVGAGIYRSTNDGASWTQVHTFSPAPVVTVKSGMFVVDVDGVPTLAMLYRPSGDDNNAYGVKSTNGTAWTTQGPFPVSTFQFHQQLDSISFHNTIYMVTANTGANEGVSVRTYNPGAGSGGSFVVNPTTSLTQGITMVVFNDRLMLVRRSGTQATPFLRVEDISTGAATLFASLVGVALKVITTGNQAKPAAFVDGSNLIVFCLGATNNVECWSLDATGAGASTPIGATVLPAALRGAVAETATLFAHVDFEASPSNPPKYLIFAANNITGTGLSMFQWNGTGAQMTLVDTGGDVGHAIGWSNCPHGYWAYSPGQVNAARVSITPLAGAEQHSFILHSPGGATVVKVRAWHGTALEESPGSAATLSDPSTGGTMNGNTVEGWVADGVTVRTVRWQAITDGYTPNQRRKLWLEIFT